MAATGATSKPILNAKGEALEQSRTDAGVLLWFATREGKKVAERVLSNIVNAQSQLNSPQRTALVEARFWTAYRDLAAAVKPASVESILSTCSSHPFRDYGGKWTLWNRNKLGNARKTKRWYAIAAVLVLIFLLVIQTYWFVMTTFSASLETNRNELDSICRRLACNGCPGGS